MRLVKDEKDKLEPLMNGLKADNDRLKLEVTKKTMELETAQVSIWVGAYVDCHVCMWM